MAFMPAKIRIVPAPENRGSRRYGASKRRMALASLLVNELDGCRIGQAGIRMQAFTARGYLPRRQSFRIRHRVLGGIRRND